MVPTITVGELLEFITKGSKGCFFSVEFFKRTTGEKRLMNCRYGVRSRLTGGGPAYDFTSKGLVCVFDSAKNNYRVIPLENVLRVKVGGEWREVVQSPKPRVEGGV